MKTQKLVVLACLILAFLSLSSFTPEFNGNKCKSEIQESMVVTATYDGKEDYGYNFITINKDGDESTLTFQKFEEGVTKTYDLNSEALIGAKFKITYTNEIKVTKDADGYEDENEINSITNLEKL